MWLLVWTNRHQVMARRFRGSRDDSGSLLASVLIIVPGTIFCLIATAALAPDSLWLVGGIAGGPAGLLLLVTVLQRWGGNRGSGLSFFSRASRSFRDDGIHEYQPRRVKSRSVSQPGSNQPITVEEARELRETSASTWIPAHGRPRRRREKKS